jgi:hypothetical protein
MKKMILSVLPGMHLLWVPEEGKTTQPRFQLIPLTTGTKKTSTYVGQWGYPLFFKTQEF